MGNRIRELRRAMGLTMKQLGEELGVAESTISHYETGRRQLDNETLLKLGEFFGVTVGYLLGVEDNSKAPADTGKRDILDDVDVAFYGTFKRLSESGKETLRAMARVLEEQENKG